MTNKDKKPFGRRRNGEGSVYQRASDGLWVGSAYVITTSGQRKRKPVYGHSFEDVHAKLVSMKERSQKGIPIPERSCTVGQYLDYWLGEVVTEKRRKTNSVYSDTVRIHIKPVLEKKKLEKLSVVDVRHLLAIVRKKCLCCINGWDKKKDDDKKCCSVGRCCKRYPSTRTVQSVHSVLRNALNSAMRDELLMRNVAELIKVPAPKYRTGKGLPVAVVKTILDAVKEHRYYIAYVLAATMGLRRGELLGLRWADLDLDEGILKVGQTVQRIDRALVVEEDAKSDDSENVVPLPAFTVRALRDHKKRQAAERLESRVWQDHDLVCPNQIGGPIEPRNFNRHFNTVRDKLDLPGVRLHDLRHSMVTLLLELGVAPHIVQAIARHAGMEITMMTYAHANMAAMRDAMRQLGEQFL
ncbi:MAG TPA: site-specific integrase [Pseudonocardiaceae bacterium]|jgi:integrase|nr:site-specific integrase [Pseudonocardiaceae bacterium]